MPDDFSKLAEMQYSGRGITIGMTEEGNAFVGYTLTGRSPSSQARKLVYDEKNGVVITDVTDKAQLEKGSPALLLYPALARVNLGIVASNGAQTNLLYSRIRNDDPDFIPDKTLELLLDGENSYSYDQKEGWINLSSFEPDNPNFTPRICGCINIALHRPQGALGIVRKSEKLAKPDYRGIEVHGFTLEPGKAWTITTYKGGNENPLMPFRGSPLESEVSQVTSIGICTSLYESIKGGEKPGDNFRVSAAVMMFRPIMEGGVDISVINRADRGE